VSDTADSDTEFLWDCTGTNSGANTSCTLKKPDLSISYLYPSSASRYIEQIFTAPVSNANSATEDEFDTYFEISSSSGIMAISEFSLAAGGSETATAAYTFLEAGTYNVRACADYSDYIEEADENNNCTSYTTVTVSDYVPCTV